MPKLTYEPGTRYSNSEIYDEATTEVVHGWQVFIQKRPDGTPTGRKSFVNNAGRLCGIEIAGSERERAKAAVTSEALEVLQELMYWDNGKSEFEKARAVIVKAVGLSAAA